MATWDAAPVDLQAQQAQIISGAVTHDQGASAATTEAR
jgi:hypothetical protein